MTRFSKVAAILPIAATFLIAAGGPEGVQAGSVLQPGGTVGLPAGAPLAEGVYFVNTSSYGQRTSTPTRLGVNLTQVIWATPISFYDTRLQVLFLQPTNYATGSTADSFYANSTLVAGWLAHSFGNGLNASYLAGIRSPQPAAAAFRQGSFEQRGTVTYNALGLNLTINGIDGIFVDPRPLYPDWFNLDLTATKRFDNVELGAVAFGSTDLSSPTPTYRRQRQFAVGGLVGYKFSKVALQAYVTRDVAQRNYTGYDTRGFLRIILPLYVAPNAPPEAIRARF